MSTRIILAGISGFKKRIVPRLEKAISEYLEGSGRGSQVVTLWAERELEIMRFLNNPLSAQLSSLFDSYDAVATDLKKKPSIKSADAILIPLHFTFMHFDRAFSPLSWPSPGNQNCPSLLLEFLRWVKPDYIINLIDDIHFIQQRIRNGPSKYELRLRELIKWRESEITVADFCANEIVRKKIGRSDYTQDRYERSPVFAIQHGSKALCRYVFEPELPRIYASFPISYVREEPDEKRKQALMNEVNEFVSALSEHFPTFNPLTIDEVPLNLFYDKVLAKCGKASDVPPRLPFPSELRWKIPDSAKITDEEVVSIPDINTQDLSDVAELVDEGENGRRSIVRRQVAARDVRLIDQSDCVAIYRPTAGPTKEWSGGTLGEYKYAVAAADNHRPFMRVYIVTDKANDGKLGQFVEHKGSATFSGKSTSIHVVDEVSDLHVGINRAAAFELLIAKIKKDSKGLTHRRAPDATKKIP